MAPASTDRLSTAVSASCGSRLVGESLVVRYVVSEGVSIHDQFFVLDGGGRPYVCLDSGGS